MDFHEAYTDTCSTVGMAARLGNLKALKQLLDKGKPADVKDNRGWFPLHEAAHAGHTNCLDWLLKQEEVDINWKTFEGETALLLACRKGQVDCAEELIKSGANTDLANNELVSPLHEACQNGSMECARLLLEAGCDVNCQDFGGDTPLHIAVEYHHSLVDLLLEYDADVCSYSEKELTPVFLAAKSGYVACLKSLLKKAKQQGKQFVVNMTASDNASPLLIACDKGHEECVEVLLDNGADPGIPVLVHYKENEQLYMDALQYATYRNHLRCVQLLLQCPRKDPRLYKCNQYHPLILAIRHDTTDCLKLLVENGFNVKQAFYDEKSHGSILCFDPSLEAAQYILEHESELNKLFKPTKPYRVYSKGLNPIRASLSSKSQDMQLLSLILKYGAKMEETDNFWHSVVSSFLNYWSYKCKTLPLYLLIRYGCKTRICLQIMQNIFPPYLEPSRKDYKCYTETLGMFMLLTPNIKTDDMNWDKRLVDFGILTPQLSQQITEDSHTLKYACRSAIVRHMISVDQWDREGLVKLGVPELIQDYLFYFEYGELGDSARSIVQEGKNFVRTGCYRMVYDWVQ